MKTKALLLIGVLIMMYGCENEKRIDYPETKKVDTVDVYFGTEVQDPYRWMEDQDAEEVGEWVKAQQDIAQNYFTDIPFRDDVEARMTRLWNYPKYQVPFREGDRYFFFKNDGLQNQSVWKQSRNYCSIRTLFRMMAPWPCRV